jgi:hypothetical protein
MARRQESGQVETAKSLAFSGDFRTVRAFEEGHKETALTIPEPGKICYSSAFTKTVLKEAMDRTRVRSISAVPNWKKMSLQKQSSGQFGDGFWPFLMVCGSW